MHVSQHVVSRLLLISTAVLFLVVNPPGVFAAEERVVSVERLLEELAEAPESAVR